MTEDVEEARPYWDPVPPTRDDFDDVDRDALDLAIELVLAEDPDASYVVRECLKDGDWWGAASQASYDKQMDHLSLDDEAPPCWIAIDEINDILARGAGRHNLEYGGALLLQKMLAAGVSKWSPRPIDDLAAAQRKKRKK